MAYDSWKPLKKPHVMFYFREVKTAAEGYNAPEVNEVRDIREKIEKENILFTDGFSAPHEFCEKIYDHLERWIRENTNNH